MNESASIGVVMPTLDCAWLVEDHVRSAGEWLDLVDEVVVVDSESKDGTVEQIKRHLKHPNVRYLQHPRGLYQSWNFGIRHIRQKYLYVSTVGDSITREGMLRLREVAETCRCDAVASKPYFVDNTGQPVQEVEWPIDRLLRLFPEYRPLILEGLLLHHFALNDVTGAILGSSASNLYLTETLQRCPFPTDFGTMGDMIWGVVHGLDSRVVLIAEKFSTFRFHPKAYTASEYAVPNMAARMSSMGQQAFDRWPGQSPELRTLLKHLREGDSEYTRRKLEKNIRRLCQARQLLWPWVLNPAAWVARIKRDHFRRKHVIALRVLAEEMEPIQRQSRLARFADQTGPEKLPAKETHGMAVRPATTR